MEESLEKDLDGIGRPRGIFEAGLNDEMPGDSECAGGRY